MVRVLKHEADFRRQFLAMPCRVETGHEDRSRRWQKESVHQPEQRALARTVVANQANAPLIKAKRGNGKNPTVRVPNHDVLENGPCGGGPSERSRSRRSAPHPGHAQDHQLTPVESSRGSGCVKLVLLTFCNPVTSRHTRRTQRGLYRRARLHKAAASQQRRGIVPISHWPISLNKAHRATAFVSHRGFFAFELNSSLTGCYPGAHPRTVLIQTATSGSAPRSTPVRNQVPLEGKRHPLSRRGPTSTMRTSVMLRLARIQQARRRRRPDRPPSHES